jgi:hypothetical protein
MTAPSDSPFSRQAAPKTMQPSRRAALAKLGLAAIVAYGAPSVTHLARAATAGASKGGSNCGKGNQPPCP